MTEERIIVHILGAGVDKPLGMPLANELMSDVANFANGPANQLQRRYGTISLIYDSILTSTRENKAKTSQNEC